MGAPAPAPDGPVEPFRRVAGQLQAGAFGAADVTGPARTAGRPGRRRICTTCCCCWATSTRWTAGWVDDANEKPGRKYGRGVWS